MFTSTTAERSPFPSRGRTIARFKEGETFPVERAALHFVKGSAFFRFGNTLLARHSKCRARQCKSTLNERALLSFPSRGRGTAPRRMR